MGSIFQRLQKADEEQKRLQAEEKEAAPAESPVDPKPLPTYARLLAEQRDSGAKEQPVLTTTNAYQPVPTPTKQTIKVSTSPEKNFTKVPNSITNEIPQGLFKGLSKHTYDVLYKLTRGAIAPKREIQLTRLELMKLTGLSENTQRAHIKYLSLAGLLKVEYQTGKHEGATYEVLVPEEIEDPSQVLPSTPNQYQALPSSSKNSQNLGGDKYQHLGVVSSTLTPENTGSNEPSKTSLKTNTNIDDELTRKINDFVREKFGRELTEKENQKLSNVIADLIFPEFEQAASLTNSISDAAAFLKTHLQRKLAGKSLSTPKPVSTAREGKKLSNTAEVVEPYQAESLTEQARQILLETFRAKIAEGKHDEVMKLKDNYTEMDWTWLMKGLS